MRFAPKPLLKPAPESVRLRICGQDLVIPVKRNARARRLTLRLDPAFGPVLTLPVRTRLGEAERFVARNAAWLEARLDRVADASPFADGAELPLRGEPCRIVHRTGRGLIRLQSGEAGTLELQVPGEADHIARRVTEWLKREARRDLTRAVDRHCERLGKPAKALRIGDARSRWGSCTSAGVLTFSWRLVLAPTAVLDYLAAHEVAHLREMNHSQAFWDIVAALDPGHMASRRWLKQHGAALHAVGREG
ncbi:hypothetical protein SAMN05216548_12230 [Faunimonas pinastri]|uniref:YgjP-like metallopeptidase domain-containing protein n=1 Tax=Faunimonas pinastri TaxID=1855383 RepID=A0A1H9PSU9_9HYPH|nr:SprT family zinc-dependent metalloprotease [Faunimonas pinastri]SER51304.1 hypothetical protein SAMN05216548_12230 [Faunimonas pinastri]